MVDVANVSPVFATPGVLVDFDEGLGEGNSSPQSCAVHVRVQQRNGRKSLTTVQGLDKVIGKGDYVVDNKQVKKFLAKVLKAIKKEFCCNGTVVEDPELGKLLQLQGDQRKSVTNYLVQERLVKKNQIKLHGF